MDDETIKKRLATFCDDLADTFEQAREAGRIGDQIETEEIIQTLRTIANRIALRSGCGAPTILDGLDARRS